MHKKQLKENYFKNEGVKSIYRNIHVNIFFMIMSYRQTKQEIFSVIVNSKYFGTFVDEYLDFLIFPIKEMSKLRGSI